MPVDPDHCYVSMHDVMKCLSDAADLVTPYLVDHHKRVAIIAGEIASELGLSDSEKATLRCSALIHDIGVFSSEERVDLLKLDAEDVFAHAHAGYMLLSAFSSFSQIADIIKFHHIRWKHGRGQEYLGERVPLSSHILHLADRVQIQLIGCSEPLSRSRTIMREIEDLSGEMFKPELVEILKSVASKEAFWFDVMSRSPWEVLDRNMNQDAGLAAVLSLAEMAKLTSRIIDFRSKFTACHSKGVAVVSERLGHLFGVSDTVSKMLNIAGHMHDLGKIAVPLDILEKPRGLTASEYDIIKRHPYYTFSVLSEIECLHAMSEWACLHHERLDGSGYPFRLKGDELTLEARVMAVADVFTALTEDRPYRSGMSRKSALRILLELGRRYKLDPDVVACVKQNFDEIDGVRMKAQRPVSENYEDFNTSSHFPVFN